MRRLLPGVFLVLVASASGCKTDETIAVHSVTFNGTHAVNPSQLRTALATREDPKLPLLNVRLPWTKRRNFFDRERFDADLKRIEAFYADRGYPDARVTSFDVKLNDKHDAVDVTITVNEGEPVRIVAVVDSEGFDMIPPSNFASHCRRTSAARRRPARSAGGAGRARSGAQRAARPWLSLQPCHLGGKRWS